MENLKNTDIYVYMHVLLLLTITFTWMSDKHQPGPPCVLCPVPLQACPAQDSSSSCSVILNPLLLTHTSNSVANSVGYSFKISLNPSVFHRNAVFSYTPPVPNSCLDHSGAPENKPLQFIFPLKAARECLFSGYGRKMQDLIYHLAATRKTYQNS